MEKRKCGQVVATGEWLVITESMDDDGVQTRQCGTPVLCFSVSTGDVSSLLAPVRQGDYVIPVWRQQKREAFMDIPICPKCEFVPFNSSRPDLTALMERV